MKIIVIDDDMGRARTLSRQLEPELSNVSIRAFYCEYDFLVALDDIEREAPDLFIVDMMLPWFVPIKGDSTVEIPPAPTPKVSYRDAGLRCINAILSRPILSKATIFVSSSLPTEQISAKIKDQPENLSIFHKCDVEEMICAIRNVIMAEGGAARQSWRPSVFIVHGHDDGAKETVARFVEKLGGNAVILHEEDNDGRTIIEKFEAHSNALFAVVLLTPDDVGGTSEDSLRSRARQNVIFELGFFFSKLGRRNVFPLCKEGVEIPSDIQGIIYTEMDQGGAWKIALIREFKAAGVPLKFDNAF